MRARTWRLSAMGKFRALLWVGSGEGLSLPKLNKMANWKARALTFHNEERANQRRIMACWTLAMWGNMMIAVRCLEYCNRRACLTAGHSDAAIWDQRDWCGEGKSGFSSIGEFSKKAVVLHWEVVYYLFAHAWQNWKASCCRTPN